MGRIRRQRRRENRARRRVRVRIGAADPTLTGVSGMAAVTELVEVLDLIALLDAAVGSVKQRARGHSVGQLLVGLAAAQLAGQTFLVGLDRVRADAAGQALCPVAGLCSTTAAGLARRVGEQQYRAVESGLAAATAVMMRLVAPARAGRLCRSVTIDLDTTDVEVYGRKKEGVAYNYQGQRCGRPHVATWAETGISLAADLGSGRDDPRATAGQLLRRALAGLPDGVEQVAVRADAGYFAAELASAAHLAGIEFAIGAKRIAPLWRALAGVAETDWADAVDMTGAQVATARYVPAWWPANTRLLIRRVALDPAQVSGDARSRRRRTLHPDQRALELDELAAADGVYAYSFVLTNRDVATPDRAVAAEYWYRHRTEVENVFRDAKHGAGLVHLPSHYAAVNTAWMWGALIATSIAGWLHQLVADPTTSPETSTNTPDQDVETPRSNPTDDLEPAADQPHSPALAGLGVRDGKAMIATLQHRLICIPARLIRHAGQQSLRLPPDQQLLAEVLARLRALTPALS